MSHLSSDGGPAEPGGSFSHPRAKKPARTPASCPGSLLRQLLAVDRLDPFLADGGDHVAKARAQIARPQTADRQVALVIERGEQFDLASRRRGKDDDLLSEIDFRDL